MITLKRIDGTEIVSYDVATVKEAVERAVREGVSLKRANLRGADLCRADLREADLRWADLYGANLSGANLYRADLRGANLCWADLREACLNGADLDGAKGIVSFGPVGNTRRIGYAVKHETCAMVQLGCFRGTETEAVEAIRTKYGEGSSYEAFVVAACREVMGR